MKRKLMIGLLFLTFFLFNSQSVYAKEAFDIINYDVDVVVNENNVLKITENITVNFHESRHGIYRNIPFVNNVRRSDGTTQTIHARIRKVNVNRPYSVSTVNNHKEIKIGDADSYVSGIQTYQISYMYDLGKDKNNGFDELYFNIIGTEWDTTIDNVSYKITMPKEFDKDKFGISAGLYGVSGSDNMIVDFDNNTITGSYTKRLSEREGITVRIELPDNYFIRENKYEFITYISLVGMILLTVSTYLLWSKYGKDDITVDTVEFYPPDNYNSCEIAYLKNKNIKDKDVVSLLIYLANKGYISIEEPDTKGKNFIINKIKEYDGDNEIEKEFMNGLFKTKNSVNKNDLENKFYTTVNNIKMKSFKLNKLIMDKTAYKKMVKAILSLLLTIIIGVIGIVVDYENFGDYFIILILATVLLSLIQLIFTVLMPKRNEYGTEILGRINGFKNFLETAEKSKLEALVLDDPKYFYNILPYTYVFGISKKWISKFESIAIEKPDWYTSSTVFDTNSFTHFMDSTINSVERSMTSSPSSGGGSSYSGGGGFSGGGSGGGGGGSW